MISFADEEIHIQGKHNDGDKGPNAKAITGEKKPQLIDDQCDGVSEDALITNGEYCPTGVVHFSFNCAHSGKAGSTEKVEN